MKASVRMSILKFISKRIWILLLAGLSSHLATVQASAATLQQRCEAMAHMTGLPAELNVTIQKVSWRADGMVLPSGSLAPAFHLPEHCEILGQLNARDGLLGQHYATRFLLRLPIAWNKRFFFQGGGGLNGDIGNAVGAVPGGAEPAIMRGYAVVSQDSGHSNELNNDPLHNGTAAFGFDPQARADYGGASLEPVTLAALVMVEHFYGHAPTFRYFCGCSKGGQEGMVVAQRYPNLFDGVISAAPGFALPRAALATVWDLQSFAQLAQNGQKPVTPLALARGFSDGDGDVVRRAILSACDGLDGLQDGIVGDVVACTNERVKPALERVQCRGPKQGNCLSDKQIATLVQVHDGVRDSTGHPLYAPYLWDAGWLTFPWRLWKTGSTDGHIPSLHLVLGIPAMASVFSTPPVVLGTDPQALLDYARHFDFDRDAGTIEAIRPPFTRSAWKDIGARSADLDAFVQHGGKMIVPHGASDPVFSLLDTFAWFDEVNARSGGMAREAIRVFAVPGMGHCDGGPATDQYDALAALVAWVEEGVAPERIVATAGPQTPWPGRTRPLCSYPQVARYLGSGDVNDAESFTCR